jgi:hypothetical protein
LPLGGVGRLQRHPDGLGAGFLEGENIAVVGLLAVVGATDGLRLVAVAEPTAQHRYGAGRALAVAEAGVIGNLHIIRRSPRRQFRPLGDGVDFHSLFDFARHAPLGLFSRVFNMATETGLCNKKSH